MRTLVVIEEAQEYVFCEPTGPSAPKEAARPCCCFLPLLPFPSPSPVALPLSDADDLPLPFE